MQGWELCLVLQGSLFLVRAGWLTRCGLFSLGTGSPEPSRCPGEDELSSGREHLAWGGQRGTASSWASSGSCTTAPMARGPWGTQQVGMGQEPDPPQLPYSMGWALPPAPGSTCEPLTRHFLANWDGLGPATSPTLPQPPSSKKGLLPRDTSHPRPGGDRCEERQLGGVYFQQQHLKIPSGCVISRSRARRAAALGRL